MTGLRTLQAFCTRDPERGYPSRLEIQKELERLIAEDIPFAPCMDCNVVQGMASQVMGHAKKALSLAEEYLIARGIEHRGTVGRTIVLPAIREALIALKNGKGIGDIK